MLRRENLGAGDFIYASTLDHLINYSQVDSTSIIAVYDPDKLRRLSLGRYAAKSPYSLSDALQAVLKILYRRKKCQFIEMMSEHSVHECKIAIVDWVLYSKKQMGGPQKRKQSKKSQKTKAK